MGLSNLDGIGRPEEGAQRFTQLERHLWNSSKFHSYEKSPETKFKLKAYFDEGTVLNPLSSG